MKKHLFIALFLGASAHAQLTSIDENFETFDAGENTIPQNGWTANKPYPYAIIYQHSQSGNKHIRAYSFMGTEPVYLIAPELVSVWGKLEFYIGSTGGTYEVGLLESPTNIASFEAVKEEATLPAQLTKQTLFIEENTKKYIAFKFNPSGAHRIMGVDNIKFKPTALSVSEINLEELHSDFVFNNIDKKLIVKNKDVKQLQIFDLLGHNLLTVATPKEEDLSYLNSGVYIVVTENLLGEQKSTKIRLH